MHYIRTPYKMILPGFLFTKIFTIFFRHMKNIEKIIVPVDFSAHSQNALEYAIDLSKEWKVKIIILHAFSIPELVGSPVDGAYIPPILDQQELAQQHMEKFLKENKRLKDVAYQTELIMGTAIDIVPNIVDNKSKAMVVMGTRGMNNLSNIIMGSITARVIEESPVPVLAIPEKVKYKKYEKIAFAYDGDRIKDNDKLAVLKNLVTYFNAHLDIVNVEENKSDLRDIKLEDFDLSPLPNDKVSLNILSGENVESELTDFFKTRKIDLACIIPHKHSFLSRLFKGSTTRKLVGDLSLPLLAV